MPKKTLLALALTTGLTAPAAAEGWYQTYESDDIIAYADADSVSRSGNIASLSIFLSHDVDDYHIRTVEIDCPANRYRVTGGANYGPDRKYLGATEYDATWFAIDNDLMTLQKRFACEGFGLHRLVGDPFEDADDYWYFYF